MTNESWGLFPLFRRICGRSLLLAYLIIRKYLCLEFRTFGVFLGCILCNCKTFGKVEVWLVIFYLGFSISLRLKFSLLNKNAEFMIELNIFVIYNLFLDMFAQKYFGQKSIWNQSLRKVSVHDIFEIKIQFTK